MASSSRSDKGKEKVVDNLHDIKQELLRLAAKSSFPKEIFAARRISFTSSDLNDLDADKLKAYLTDYGRQITMLMGIKRTTYAELPSADQEFLFAIYVYLGEDDECLKPIPSQGITFGNIAGQFDAKQKLDLEYIYPLIFSNLFREGSKSVLLYGPPGTGKTLLARAATSSIPRSVFFAPTPAELKGKYEGETEKQIKAVFDCAQRSIDSNTAQNAIIFLDEFESLAGERSDDASMARSVNAFLQAMDGVQKRRGVSVVAATNYPWRLDSAILRRFSARILVDLPDTEAIEWLVRSALYDAYAPPDVSDQDRKIPTLLDEHGHILRNMNGQVIWKDFRFALDRSRRCAETNKPLFASDQIEYIVKQFDIKPNGAAVKNQIIGNGSRPKPVKPSDVANENYIGAFGYSASDIAKIMSIAIQHAAHTALRLDTFMRDEHNGKKFYWAYPRNTGSENTIRYSKLSAQEQRDIQDKLYNFSICIDDFNYAIKEYPTTIESDMYVKILNYRYIGKPEYE
jgi:SpoVK/Ycf46/Vps4 family AAA+-type ATPase